jgi:hypothetical protein
MTALHYHVREVATFGGEQKSERIFADREEAEFQHKSLEIDIVESGAIIQSSAEIYACTMKTCKITHPLKKKETL